MVNLAETWPPTLGGLGAAAAAMAPQARLVPEVPQVPVRLRQSLVLSDYLQTLDEQIQTLQQEMESLETRNSLIRAKVSPLLWPKNRGHRKKTWLKCWKFHEIPQTQKTWLQSQPYVSICHMSACIRHCLMSNCLYHRHEAGGFKPATDKKVLQLGVRTSSPFRPAEFN